MFKKKDIFRSFLCLFLTLTLCCVSAFGASAASLEELRAEQEALEQQKEENDAKLEELRQDISQKKAYRDTLQRQIDTVQDDLDLLREKIDGLNEEITRAEKKIEKKQESIGKNWNLLKERIKALYVAGDASSLELILNSRDILDFTGKIQVLRAVTRHDQQLLDMLAEQLEEIREDLSAIQADKEELSQSKKKLDARSAELSDLYAEARQMIADAEEEESNAENASELLDSQIAENEEAIAQLEEELKQQEIFTGGYVGSGTFLWPMPGYTYLTCLFGDGGHRGIDIAGGDIYGKPIVAADSGTVIYAGWNDSYGYCVFIDHGNGYETRYAHMCELGTVTGAAVEQGQVIGYAGSTGNSTGPHLHFEVISYGGLTDPMGYF